MVGTRGGRPASYFSERRKKISTSSEEHSLFILDLKLIYIFDPGASLLEIILKH